MIKKILLVSVFASMALSNTLPSLLEKAVNNKIVEVSKNQLDASKLDYKSLKNSYLPSVHLNSNYSNTSNETPSSANSSFNSSLEVQYSIYDGGRKNNTYDSFKSKIKMQDLNLDDLKNRIALDIVTLYFNYLSYVETYKVKEQEIKQLQTQYEKQKRFFETETIAIDEVEKILSRLENANVQLQEIELQKQTILHNLEYIIGEKVNIDNGSKVIELSSSKANLRADIQALEYEMKSVKSDAKVSKSSLYPQLNINNTMTYYDNNFDNKAYDPNVDTQNTLMLNLSWKLFDFDSTQKTYEANMKRYQALKSQYEYEKNKMDVDLRLAYKSYDISKMKIKSANASLKSANSTYSAIEAKYQNSLVDNVAFLEALSEKYDAISTLKNVLYELEIKKANIIYYSGKNIIDFVK